MKWPAGDFGFSDREFYFSKKNSTTLSDPVGFLGGTVILAQHAPAIQNLLVVVFIRVKPRDSGMNIRGNFRPKGCTHTHDIKK